MDVQEEHAWDLAELAADTPCGKDHACLKSNPGERCRARLAAERKVVFCLEDDARRCPYRVFFGRGVVCTCPVRKYIAEHLHA